MNILFYTAYKVSPTKGGTERTTISVATALTNNFDCKVYSIYSQHQQTPKEPCFIEEYHIKNIAHSINEVRHILEINNIDVIINQNALGLAQAFRKAIGNNLKCKLITAHHFDVGWEINMFRKEVVYKSYKTSHNIQKLKYAIIFYLFPLFKQRVLGLLKKNYKGAYIYSDALVLLSESFIKNYIEFSGLRETSKIHVISNGLSYNEYLDLSLLNRKKKNFVIVARLDETPKKISEALYIWQLVKKSPCSKEWTLSIIGYGNDKDYYEKIVQQQHINDVYFLGRKQPREDYIESSIFMMTSTSESWGLTLTEAQQFGVVPLAFDTYSSLHDIITDGKNGFIIPPYNRELYADKIISLMKNKEMRNEIAKQCIESSKRFDMSVIGEKWYQLLRKLSNE